MVVTKEFHSEENSTELQDPYDAEEALSLCDLPMYSDAADWDDFSKEDQRLSSDQDLFEFFSEDFTTASTYPAENIIFCGKLIPYREPPVSERPPKLENDAKRNPKKKSLFRWKSASYSKSKSSSFDSAKGSKSCSKPRKITSSKALSAPVSENYRFANGKCMDKYDFSVRKVSIGTSRTKSRWYLFMFGMTRFPTEMALRDIKTRQSRRTPSNMFQSVDSGKMVKGNRRRRSRKGLWWLFRALGCRSQRSTAVVKALSSCIPHA